MPASAATTKSARITARRANRTTTCLISSHSSAVAEEWIQKDAPCLVTIYLTRYSWVDIVQFMDKPRTLLQAIRHFADPNNCLHYMVERRWPTGEITCPSCGGGHLRFDRKRLVWTCNNKHPRRQFSVKVGTIFEDSPLGLDKWLPTVWMITNMKNGVSSHEVARSLGVTQKTAWFMLHRVRLAMHDERDGKMSGVVEADETY